MSEPNEELDHDLMTAIAGVQVHFGDWSFEQLARRLDEIEVEFTARLRSARAGEIVELRRLIAENQLTAAQSRSLPVSVCEALLARSYALGWTNLSAKATKLFPFCRYCLDQGVPEVGLRYLEPLIAELRAAQKGGDAESSAFLEHLTPLLAALQSGR